LVQHSATAISLAAISESPLRSEFSGPKSNVVWVRWNEVSGICLPCSVLGAPAISPSESYYQPDNHGTIHQAERTPNVENIRPKPVIDQRVGSHPRGERGPIADPQPDENCCDQADPQSEFRTEHPIGQSVCRACRSAAATSAARRTGCFASRLPCPGRHANAQSQP